VRGTQWGNQDKVERQWGHAKKWSGRQGGGIRVGHGGLNGETIKRGGILEGSQSRSKRTSKNVLLRWGGLADSVGVGWPTLDHLRLKNRKKDLQTGGDHPMALKKAEEEKAPNEARSRGLIKNETLFGGGERSSLLECQRIRKKKRKSSNGRRKCTPN